MKNIFIFLILMTTLIFGCDLNMTENNTYNDQPKELNLSEKLSESVSSSVSDVSEKKRNIKRITYGLVAEWKSDILYRYPFSSRRIIFDTSSNNNTGYPQGIYSVTYGWLGNSLYYNGSTYVYVNNHGSINFGTGDFSISCWIKPVKINGVVSILDKRQGSTGYHLYIYNGYVGLQLADGSHTNYTSTYSYKLLKNKWHHIAVTVDRDNTQGLKIFIDGMRVATLNPRGRMRSITNSTRLLIGKHKDWSSSNFIGRIDELSLFNRALSETEARQLMYPGTPAYDPSYWNNSDRDKNNCYNYSANKKTNTFAQPGKASGIDLGSYFDSVYVNTSYTTQQKINKLKEAAEADGLQPISGDWFSLIQYKGVVALVFSEDTMPSNPYYDPDDYHFYRLDDNGVLWSHKPGQSYARNYDNSQNYIYDPKNADTGVYTHFVGYYRLWSDSIQGIGHEYIR